MGTKFSRSFVQTVLTVAIVLAAAPAWAKVYRWVDENGEVHYSESLPPDFQDKTHDELDEAGIVRETDQSLAPPPPKPKVESEDEPNELPRDSSGMKRPKPLYSEAEVQNQMDRFLLLRYDSAQEIEEAMNVEIKQLEYDRGLLKKSRDSLYESYRGHILEAANRQRAGTDLDPEADKAISDLKRRLNSNGTMLGGLEARESEIRKNFGAEIDRYNHLLETWSEES